MTSLLLAASLVISAPLAAGDPVPNVKFKDVDGKKGSTADYRDRIIVFTFAQRESSERLMAWRERANLYLAKKHPELRVANVNFADVASVPGFMKGVVDPILRSVNEKSQKKSRDVLEKNNIKYDPNNPRFHLIADWEGDYLKAFRIEDAEKFYCWVAKDGKIVETFHEGEPELETRFVNTMINLGATQAASPSPTTTPVGK